MCLSMLSTQYEPKMFIEHLENLRLWRIFLQYLFTFLHAWTLTHSRIEEGNIDHISRFAKTLVNLINSFTHKGPIYCKFFKRIAFAQCCKQVRTIKYILACAGKLCFHHPKESSGVLVSTNGRSRHGHFGASWGICWKYTSIYLLYGTEYNQSSIEYCFMTAANAPVGIQITLTSVMYPLYSTWHCYLKKRRAGCLSTLRYIAGAPARSTFYDWSCIFSSNLPEKTISPV